MNLPYEWQLGWRYTRAGRGGRRNAFISFIAGASMAGIALGVAALIVVLSVINGFQREVRDRMLGVVPHVQALHPQGADPTVIDEVLPRLRAEAAVRAWTPFASAPALIVRGDEVRSVVVRGIEPAAEAQVSSVAERFLGPALSRLEAGSRRLVIGAELARVLQLKAGDSVLMAAAPAPGSTSRLPSLTRFEVAGVIDVGHHEYDSAMAWMHRSDALQLLGASAVSGIALRLADPQVAPAVAARLSVELPPPWQLRDWTRTNRVWFEAVQSQKRMIGVILTLIVAVAAFNLVSTLVMTVVDKRGEIAILRTLGASPRSVMAVFVVHGLVNGIAGTLIGLVLGLALAWNLDTLVPALEQLLGTRLVPSDIYLIDHLPADPRAGDIVPIVLASLALSFAATLYPSWRASRLEPAMALRNE
ncbi:MAG: lipoprotein-releasing ABC transporter permease subunit [Burkholderiaceae bacterium]|nr:lipoprotein-releasing ABC transporter permease subunit [Burkholderiaceae bacterium]